MDPFFENFRQDNSSLNNLQNLIIFAMEKISNLDTTCNHINQNNELNVNDIIKICNMVVQKYINNNIIPLKEKEDIVMSIVEKFWNSKDKINSSFQGKSLITTYYSAIINKMCCELIRKEKKHWYNTIDSEYDDFMTSFKSNAYETEKNIILKNEINRLSKSIMLFGKNSHKVNLFIKYYYNIQIYDSDIQNYTINNFDFVKRKLKNKPNEKINKAEKFENIASIINFLENKKIKSDAARMWLNKNIQTILSRLNHNGNSKHNEETLSILLEMKDKF